MMQKHPKLKLPRARLAGSRFPTSLRAIKASYPLIHRFVQACIACMNEQQVHLHRLAQP